MSVSFPVVILAGGLATRLRPMTEVLPKALISIRGEPFINHQLRLLRDQGVHEVVLCLGYLGEMIEELIGNGQQFGLNVSYVYDGPTLLGTAGAIKRALPSVFAEHFFVLYGDSYLTCDYASVKAAFLASQKTGLMTVFKNQNQWDTSNVEYKNGQILAYSKSEKTSRMHYIDYGLSVFHRKVFDKVEPLQPSDLSIVCEELVKNNQLGGFEVSQRFYEIGSFAGINEFEYYLGEIEIL
jgi:N-acetyl-alpha-D-muramate 1-phosphate uridylyltransferase